MKSPKKLAPIFAEIEPYIYLCNVKEMIIVELIKKSNECAATQGVRISRSKRFDSWWHHYRFGNKKIP